MKLTSRTSVPPGLFRFKHPVSGFEIARHSWDLMRADVTRHCDANGFDPVSDEEIERQMCERFGSGKIGMYCEGEGITVAGVSLGWRDILRGTKVMADFLIGGRTLVDRDEAERRAAICAGCERNVGFSKPCGGLCGELAEAVKLIVGNGETSVDSRLEACSVCKCSLKSKVWIPMDVLKTHDTPEFQAQYPDFCWQKQKNL